MSTAYQKLNVNKDIIDYVDIYPYQIKQYHFMKKRHIIRYNITWNDRQTYWKEVSQAHHWVPIKMVKLKVNTIKGESKIHRNSQW